MALLGRLLSFCRQESNSRTVSLCLSPFTLRLDGSLLLPLVFPRRNQTPVPLSPKVQRLCILRNKWWRVGGATAHRKLPPEEAFFNNFFKCIYLFLAVLGICFFH